jgi:hypothetical protein
VILFAQGYSPNQESYNAMILFYMGLAYRILCYLSLHLFNRSKRA